MTTHTTIIPAFAVAPAIAARHESEIARVMHMAELKIHGMTDMDPDDRRAAILSRIEGDGARFRDLQESIPATDATIANDLKRMRAEGRIVGPIDSRYFIAGQEPIESGHDLGLKRRAATMAKRTAAMDRRFISKMSAGPMSVVDVAAVFGVSGAAARKRVLRLCAEGRLQQCGQRPGQRGGTPAKLYAATTSPHSAKSGAPATVGADGRGKATSGAQEGQV